nr:GNAT family N-acyltransferase [Aureimonas endophytica]
MPAPVRRLKGRFDPHGRVLGRIANLEVRLARSGEEVRAAQQLRFRVFYEEMSARPSRIQKLTRRDKDAFDLYCDHLLVIDTARGAGEVVGTYRLMRQDCARLAGGFYTAAEFCIDDLVARHPTKRFMELGRSCVLKEYRSKRTVELLWQGIWAYVMAHRVDVLFGCASLEGTDLDALSGQLALLGSAAPPPDEWRVRAHPGRAVPLARGETGEDARRTLSALPPLVKGYLRLGGYIGPDAVVDHQFGTTDVLVVLPVANIGARYVDYYGDTTRRPAA